MAAPTTATLPGSAPRLLQLFKQWNWQTSSLFGTLVVIALLSAWRRRNVQAPARLKKSNGKTVFPRFYSMHTSP